MSDVIITTPPEYSDVTKEDRRDQVLKFLEEHRLALPQRAIYRNLRLHYGITFGYSSVDNYLDEFVEEGLCRRVNPKKLDERKLVDMPSGKNQPAYYIITEDGIDKVTQ